MEKDRIIKLLKSHICELNQLGIRHVALFGSIARIEERPGSDIDLMVDFSPPYTFDRYIRAKFYLEELLGRPVDLVLPDTLKPRVRSSVLQEAIHVA